jgi:hypothetical protein
MAKYDQGGGCACGLMEVCDCDNAKVKYHPSIDWIFKYFEYAILQHAQVQPRDYMTAFALSDKDTITFVYNKLSGRVVFSFIDCSARTVTDIEHRIISRYDQLYWWCGNIDTEEMQQYITGFKSFITTLANIEIADFTDYIEQAKQLRKLS